MIPEPLIPFYLIGCLIFTVWMVIDAGRGSSKYQSVNHKRVDDLEVAVIMSPLWPIFSTIIFFSYIGQTLKK